MVNECELEMLEQARLGEVPTGMAVHYIKLDSQQSAPADLYAALDNLCAEVINMRADIQRMTIELRDMRIAQSRTLWTRIVQSIRNLF